MPCKDRSRHAPTERVDVSVRHAQLAHLEQNRFTKHYFLYDRPKIIWEINLEHGDHELLIEPYVIPKEKIFPPLPFRIKRPVNARPFSLGLEVTNKGSSDFPGGTISNIRIFLKDYEESFGVSLKLQALKPGDFQELLVDKGVVVAQSGLHWVDCKVKADDRKKIITYQRTLGGEISSGKPSKPKYMNKPGWCRNPLLVDDLFQLHQRRINYWLVILTTILVVITIFLLLSGRQIESENLPENI